MGHGGFVFWASLVYFNAILRSSNMKHPQSEWPQPHHRHLIGEGVAKCPVPLNANEDQSIFSTFAGIQ